PRPLFDRITSSLSTSRGTARAIFQTDLSPRRLRGGAGWRLRDGRGGRGRGLR
ncbi:hypothetical protein P7K49_004326, partial [Saguinus oedipus]